MTEPNKIHRTAATGFPSAVESYERGRPDYPLAALECMKTELSLASGAVAADIGAGTGKFTRQLVKTGAKIIAIEPVEEMRSKLISNLPDIDVFEGTAESIPLQDESVDIVVAAQAFHWFDGEKALKEFHRILRKGGKLGLIWNARDESVEWVAELDKIYAPYEGATPRYKSGQWKSAFSSPLFTQLEHRQFRHVQICTVQMVVDRVKSTSFIAALPPDEQRNVSEQVRTLLRTHPTTANKDQVELPYLTDVYWCTRL
jgi:SAM-dependent methyltransferase